MRKLSMRGKPRKSETPSESDSNENGVGARSAQDEASSETETPKTEKIEKKSKKGRKSVAERPTREESGSDENGNPPKKAKKDEHKASTSRSKVSSEKEEEFEVAKITGHRTIKGRRQFLVRWKGYDEDADTWELEKDLSCSELIEEYLADIADEEESEKPPKTPRGTKERKVESKGKTPQNQASKKNASKNESVANSGSDSDETEKDKGQETKEYEVEKIIEVHKSKKDNRREFLIRWKGFSSNEDTWEPEENLNCPDLISKFMEKVDKAKKTDPRELRTNPSHTKRYTLMSTDPGRRLSRRNKDKQRATYHQCDE